MLTGSKYPVDFVGGHFEIKAQEEGSAKDGSKRIFDPKVDLSKIVDQWGRCNPSVFLNMVKATSQDATAIKHLEDLAKYGKA